MLNDKKYYLNFESQYRNRNLWPSPGEFEILVNQPGTQFDILNTNDPVSLAAPRVAWTGNLFDIKNPGQNFVPCNVTVGNQLGALLSLKVIPIEAAIGTFQHKYNYYNRALLKNQAKTKQARIKDFIYLGKSETLEYALIKTENDIYLDNGDIIEIQEASSFEVPLNGVLFVPTGSFLKDDFFNYYIFNESLNSYRKITSYDSETSTINFKVNSIPLFPRWLTSHNFSIRLELPSYTGALSITNNNTNRVINLVGGSNIKNDYLGSFVRVLPLLYQPSFPNAAETEIRRIVAYDAQNKLATVNPVFSENPSGLKVEVLNFSYDNAQGYVYTGPSPVINNQYGIRLLHLILPNQVIKGSIGGKISLYPFVNVELSSIDITNQYLIMTNNPTANKVMFKVAIDNVVDFDTRAFINCTSNDMTQTIKFDANINYKLKVSIPNGHIFNPVKQDTISPFPSDPTIQLSALFEISKLST